MIVVVEILGVKCVLGGVGLVLVNLLCWSELGVIYCACNCNMLITAFSIEVTSM